MGPRDSLPPLLRRPQTMTGLLGVALVVVLMIFAAVLAVAEAAMSRMSRVRALTLCEEGHRNGPLLERIENDPPRYLNPIYFAVMLVQNGSAILVAILAEHYLGDLGLTITSIGFTLVYFLLVEAMAKTFGVLHSDRAALTLVPVVWLLSRVLHYPTRLLIGIANVLLPGKGLKQGPFVSEQDIRSMAEVGHEEGSIAEVERKMIHSIFEFGDTLVAQIMVPRPDIVAVEVSSTLHAALDVVLEHDFSRVPVYRGELDRVEGIMHVKDALKAMQRGQSPSLKELLLPAHFVPKSKKASDLLREMRRQKFHMAIVSDEYGSVSGLLTLEDLLEQLVGEIADEHDVEEERDVEPLGEGRYRVDASLPVQELNDLLDTDLPREGWNTVGGLMYGLLGTIPSEGQPVAIQGWRFTAEKVQGRRVTKVLVTREAQQDS